MKNKEANDSIEIMRKNKNNILFGILFGILMVFLFSFMIQEHFKPFKTKELSGYFQKPPQPSFRWEWYKNGYFQKSVENYITNNYGFREPIIRMYHQYCWDFFRKEYVSYIYPGKENWLYYGHNIEDYYGSEMYHWYPDAEAAKEGYEQEVRLLNKVKAILADYDVTLLTFIAPSKSIIYPEYLPRRKHDTASLNAREYFIKRFDETHLPCIDMNEYFLQMKDTCSFYLFQPTADHWNFSCVYAADTLLRFMEQLRETQLPRIEYGNKYLSTCRLNDTQDRDLEVDLNLIRPVKLNPKFNYKERDYQVVHDSTTIKPSVLFIGNSFLNRLIAYLPPKEVFSDFQFWYYNKVAYQSSEMLADSVAFLNRLDYLIDADYIVWSSSASQMYRATEGFAEDAIIQLCVGNERFQQRKDELMDSLSHDEKTWAILGYGNDNSLFKSRLESYAEKLLTKDPEAYFPEIAGKGVPEVRNPELLKTEFWSKRDIRRQIKHDPQWTFAVACSMITESLTFQQAIDKETERVLAGLPSLREKQIGSKEYKKVLIRQMEQSIRDDRDWLKAVKEDAVKRGITVDECVTIHASYMVNKQIQEGKIKLPETDTIPKDNL